VFDGVTAEATEPGDWFISAYTAMAGAAVVKRLLREKR
jgi:hypothetical protein